MISRSGRFGGTRVFDLPHFCPFSGRWRLAAQRYDRAPGLYLAFFWYKFFLWNNNNIFKKHIYINFSPLPLSALVWLFFVPVQSGTGLGFKLTPAYLLQMCIAFCGLNLGVVCVLIQEEPISILQHKYSLLCSISIFNLLFRRCLSSSATWQSRQPDKQRCCGQTEISLFWSLSAHNLPHVLLSISTFSLSLSVLFYLCNHLLYICTPENGLLEQPKQSRNASFLALQQPKAILVSLSGLGGLRCLFNIYTVSCSSSPLSFVLNFCILSLSRCLSDVGFFFCPMGNHDGRHLQRVSTGKLGCNGGCGAQASQGLCSFWPSSARRHRKVASAVRCSLFLFFLVIFIIFLLPFLPFLLCMFVCFFVDKITIPLILFFQHLTSWSLASRILTLFLFSLCTALNGLHRLS